MGTASLKTDQIGYLPEHQKFCVLTVKGNDLAGQNFDLKKDGSNSVVFSGEIKNTSVFDKDSGNFTIKLDFSSFKDPGKYYVEAGKTSKSCAFEISNSVYDSLFYNTMRGFYFQRCGTRLDKPFAKKWSRPACHLHDAIVLETGRHKKSIGGWHDAGDYGKKVVPGAVSVGILLKMYELSPDKFSKVSLDIPNKNSMPDILSEVKFELDWLLTMQRKDGGVYHLIATKKFPPLGTMPEKDIKTRYFVGVSSAATADFAAAMAMAARTYNAFDPKFASNALYAAEKAWVFLEQHKSIVPKGGYKDPVGFKNTGAYEDKDDRDERFWAAVELYKTTGKTEYQDYIITNYKSWSPAACYPFSWLDVHVLGMFDYVTIKNRQINDEIKEKIGQDLISCANYIETSINKNGYRLALSSTDFYWGSNGVALNYGILLLMVNEVKPNPNYIEGALDQLHYVLGRNPLNLCFVTGMGTYSPKNPLHSPSIADGIKDPVPGLLVGGPNAGVEDKIAAHYKKKYNLPPSKCYIDDHDSYSTNEVSIYWNAILAFISGYFL